MALIESVSVKIFKPLVPFFDAVFSALVVGPLVIVYWVSSWELYNTYLKPDDPLISATISLSIGVGVQFLLIFYQNAIAKVLVFKNNKWFNSIASKLYTTLFTQVIIHLWRGIWKFIDVYTPTNNASLTLNIVQNSMILIASKTLVNLIAPPFLVSTDEDVENNRKLSTYHKREVNA